MQHLLVKTKVRKERKLFYFEPFLVFFSLFLFPFFSFFPLVLISPFSSSSSFFFFFYLLQMKLNLIHQKIYLNLIHILIMVVMKQKEIVLMPEIKKLKKIVKVEKKEDVKKIEKKKIHLEEKDQEQQEDMVVHQERNVMKHLCKMKQMSLNR